MLSRIPTRDQVAILANKQAEKGAASIRELVLQRLMRLVHSSEPWQPIIMLDVRQQLTKHGCGFKSVTRNEILGPMNANVYYRLAYEIGNEIVEAGWTAIITGPRTQVGLLVWREMPRVFPFYGPALVAFHSEARLLRAVRDNEPINEDFTRLPLNVSLTAANAYEHIPESWGGPPRVGSTPSTSTAIRNALRSASTPRWTASPSVDEIGRRTDPLQDTQRTFAAEIERLDARERQLSEELATEIAQVRERLVNDGWQQAPPFEGEGILPQPQTLPNPERVFIGPVPPATTTYVQEIMQELGDIVDMDAYSANQTTTDRGGDGF